MASVNMAQNRAWNLSISSLFRGARCRFTVTMGHLSSVRRSNVEAGKGDDDDDMVVQAWLRVVVRKGKSKSGHGAALKKHDLSTNKQS